MFFFLLGEQALKASPQGKPVLLSLSLSLVLLLLVLLCDCLSVCLKEKKRVWPAIILTPSHR